MNTRLIRFALVLVVSLPLQSCFTTGLWASGIRPEHKAALTPVSVALDVITLPAQLAVFDEDHHHHRGRHHHHHRVRHHHHHHNHHRAAGPHRRRGR